MYGVLFEIFVMYACRSDGSPKTSRTCRMFNTCTCHPGVMLICLFYLSHFTVFNLVSCSHLPPRGYGLALKTLLVFTHLLLCLTRALSLFLSLPPPTPPLLADSLYLSLQVPLYTHTHTHTHDLHARENVIGNPVDEHASRVL